MEKEQLLYPDHEGDAWEDKEKLRREGRNVDRPGSDEATKEQAKRNVESKFRRIDNPEVDNGLPDLTPQELAAAGREAFANNEKLKDVIQRWRQSKQDRLSNDKKTA